MTRPEIKDDDEHTITASVNGEVKMSWTYNDETRSEKMRQAHYWCDGYMCGAGAPLIPAEKIAAIWGPKPMSGIESIANERHRQITAEGWTPEHDDTHTNGELATAASLYARDHGTAYRNHPPKDWPWDREWWKPKDRRSDLVRAGALIAAEIDRLDRLADRE